MNFTEGKVREDLMLFLSNLFRVNVKQDQDLPPPSHPPLAFLLQLLSV